MLYIPCTKIYLHLIFHLYCDIHTSHASLVQCYTYISCIISTMLYIHLWMSTSHAQIIQHVQYYLFYSLCSIISVLLCLFYYFRSIISVLLFAHAMNSSRSSRWTCTTCTKIHIHLIHPLYMQNKNTHNTQINLNKQKLGEPSAHLKPVEQTLYSATVPIKNNETRTSCPSIVHASNGWMRRIYNLYIHLVHIQVRAIGSMTYSHVFFRKRATNHRALLRKIIYEDKTS